MLIRSTSLFNHPPEWAVLERQLIDSLNQSAEPLLEKYVRPDGYYPMASQREFQQH